MPSPSPKPHAKMTVEELMRETGFDRDYAEFFLAQARGQVKSDVVIVDRKPARSGKRRS